ncbi:hypothetical protein [Flavobacterium sp.]
MEVNNIELLVEKYFRGETSTAEEQELKNYFALPDVAPSLEQYKPMFSYFATAKKETASTQVILKEKKSNKLAWLSVAASVLVLCSVGFYVSSTTSVAPHQDLGTFDNPEVAFKETQKALDLISIHLNTGIEGMTYINEFEKSKNIIFKK